MSTRRRPVAAAVGAAASGGASGSAYTSSYSAPPPPPPQSIYGYGNYATNVPDVTGVTATNGTMATLVEEDEEEKKNEETATTANACTNTHQKGSKSNTLQLLPLTRNVLHDNSSTQHSNDKKKKKKMVKQKQYKQKPSKWKAMVLIFLMNLTVICIFHYMRLPQRDLTKLPGVASFLEAHHRRMLENDYVVLLTASTTHAKGTVVTMGRSNRTALDALHSCIRQLPALLQPHRSAFKWFKIDVVTGIYRLENFDYERAFSRQQFGDWFGIALGWQVQNVFLPDQVRAHSIVDRQGYLRWDRLLRALAEQHRSQYYTPPGMLPTQRNRRKQQILELVPDYGDDATFLESIDLFHTESIFIDLADPHHRSTALIVPMERGHAKTAATTKITPSQLRREAFRIGNYLTQTTTEEGYMVSNYKPRSHILEYSHSSSELWHGNALTLWSMAQLLAVKLRAGEASHETEAVRKSLVPAIEAGIKALNPQFCTLLAKDDNEHSMKHGKCLVEADGSSRLSTNAALLLALVEYLDATKSMTHLETIKGIASYVESCFLGRDPEQLFVQRVVHKEHGIAKDLDYAEDAAPAQAALALARLCNVFDKHRLVYPASWKECAVATVEASIAAEEREGDGSDYVPDSALLLAMAEAYKLHRHTSLMVEYAADAFRFVGKYQIRLQRGGEGANAGKRGRDARERPDLGGSLAHDASATASAEMSHALCRVSPLLEPDQKKALRSYLQSSARYQLQCQMRPETALYLKDPQRILGGMYESPLSLDMSNVDSAMNIVSFLCMANQL